METNHSLNVYKTWTWFPVQVDSFLLNMPQVVLYYEYDHDIYMSFSSSLLSTKNMNSGGSKLSTCGTGWITGLDKQCDTLS